MMTVKLQNYIQLAGQTAAQVTKNPDNWTGFLTTASRLYRYPFPDQLMIHAQRPKATACAGYDLWNKRMGRYVRRGSKGIGLVGISRGGYPKLRYVFDVVDTGKKNESASLFQWQYKEEYRGIVTKALEERFSISGEKGLVYQLEMVAVKLANDFWKNFHKDIMYECEGSFLEGLDEQQVSVRFRLAAAASISYVFLVDESDLYKNLFLYTKMRNVAGLSTADAQKSSDMFAKCRYLDEITGGRGIVFATGTPISNSMTEMYSIQRYLQYDRLQEMGMGQFDSWASRFGETITALDIACQL